MGEIKLDGYICERCSHAWVSRLTKNNSKIKPVVCPACKSPYWNIPRKIKLKGKKNE
jgi:DNA-directed RNA polymerase subunit RPC12/RpoP